MELVRWIGEVRNRKSRYLTPTVHYPKTLKIYRENSKTRSSVRLFSSQDTPFIVFVPDTGRVSGSSGSTADDKLMYPRVQGTMFSPPLSIFLTLSIRTLNNGLYYYTLTCVYVDEVYTDLFTSLSPQDQSSGR